MKATTCKSRWWAINYSDVYFFSLTLCKSVDTSWLEISATIVCTKPLFARQCKEKSGKQMLLLLKTTSPKINQIMKEIVNLKCNYLKLFFTILIALLVFNLGIGKIHAQQFEYIDLTRYVNQSFTDEQANDGKGGWTDFGRDNCFHNLPLETSTFEDGIVPFQIINPAKNKGKSALVLSGPQREEAFPKVSKQIKVDAKFESLFFLHTCMYVNENSKELVKYKIHYDDETEEVFVCENRNDDML